MTPMMPKISVSPEATRNSSSPYWTAFRHWTRKVAKSTGQAMRRVNRCPPQLGLHQRHEAPGRHQASPDGRVPRPQGWRPSGAGAKRLGGSHLAAARRGRPAPSPQRRANSLFTPFTSRRKMSCTGLPAGRQRELAARAVHRGSWRMAAISASRLLEVALHGRSVRRASICAAS